MCMKCSFMKWRIQIRGESPNEFLKFNYITITTPLEKEKGCYQLFQRELF